MSIVESTNSKRSTRTARIGGLAGMALVSAAAFIAAPRAAHGAAWIETGNDSWFNTASWASGTVTGFLPESGGSNVGGVININANNAVMPATGVLFDPGNQIGNANYVAKIETGPANIGTFYVVNSNTSTTVTAATNALTVLSGTFEAWAWTVGRDGSALLTQNGGTIISDGKFTVSGANSAAGDGSFVQGSGTYAYHGGTLIVKNQLQVAGGNNANATITNQEIGKWVIYNDGADGAIQIANSIKIASNSAGTGSLGIVEFHYDLNTHGVGDVRPVQDNVNTTNSQLSFSNGTNTLDELNLVLDAAPTGGQNLGLFKQNVIAGSGTFPHIFFATDGVTGYTQGATISAAFGGQTYVWTISYSGTIQFSNTANSAYSVTAATGGNDIVLVTVPEPASLALLGGAGSLILSRRRQRKA